uniref:Uncharacterized protein n=1 Tax=Chromera velia CCMP2878 TaxID=1169474 RepID=A0A0G4HC61_9ALVE|eukprot:Cvel_26151.t1-p1 / transcript=Cvel_26151.t1 / gene=Cvel_26151 / organism=Chromera_velia_CCMP2878 / gene_product=Methyltransferase-like protein 4, putative / transcript_product=Methyltransferase-like protein 4, putative / location=Cvel_scaffold3067:17748-19951(+) / protein_length=589 / sequence_SO=supercontig / SO=protein_coding / is_pseudo=false
MNASGFGSPVFLCPSKLQPSLLCREGEERFAFRRRLEDLTLAAPYVGEGKRQCTPADIPPLHGRIQDALVRLCVPADSLFLEGAPQVSCLSQIKGGLPRKRPLEESQDFLAATRDLSRSRIPSKSPLCLGDMEKCSEAAPLQLQSVSGYPHPHSARSQVADLRTIVGTAVICRDREAIDAENAGVSASLLRLSLPPYSRKSPKSQQDEDREEKEDSSARPPEKTTGTLTVVLPDGAAFLLCRLRAERDFSSALRCGLFSALRQRGVSDGLRFVVLDPPWPCLSVSRSRQYYTHPLSKKKEKGQSFNSKASSECESLSHLLLSLPVTELCHPTRGVVGVWVTNNPQTRLFVLDTLFPTWGLRHLCNVVWVKVTSPYASCKEGRRGTEGTDGRPRLVCPLSSPHRKPYETLIIGVRQEKGAGDGHESVPSTESDVPNLLFFSPPTSHSRKPSSSVIYRRVLHPSLPIFFEKSEQEEGETGGRAARTESSYNSSDERIAEGNSDRACALCKTGSSKEGEETDRHEGMEKLEQIREIDGVQRGHREGGNEALWGVEFFARNLEAGWISVGEECLKFQSVENFKIKPDKTTASC